MLEKAPDRLPAGNRQTPWGTLSHRQSVSPRFFLGWCSFQARSSEDALREQPQVVLPVCRVVAVAVHVPDVRHLLCGKPWWQGRAAPPSAWPNQQKAKLSWAISMAVACSTVKDFPPRRAMFPRIAKFVNGELPRRLRHFLSQRDVLLEPLRVLAPFCFRGTKKSPDAMRHQMLQVMPRMRCHQRHRPGQHGFHHGPAP